MNLVKHKKKRRTIKLVAACDRVIQNRKIFNTSHVGANHYRNYPKLKNGDIESESCPDNRLIRSNTNRNSPLLTIRGNLSKLSTDSSMSFGQKSFYSLPEIKTLFHTKKYPEKINANEINLLRRDFMSNYPMHPNVLPIIKFYINSKYEGKIENLKLSLNTIRPKLTLQNIQTNEMKQIKEKSNFQQNYMCNNLNVAKLVNSLKFPKSPRISTFHENILVYKNQRINRYKNQINLFHNFSNKL
ncbi:hypothetical protein A3Q56_06233 [Intoshia linei]|uniref:Uncharacterized protein n=1 Tax=Intoshia linei TaxID=1819745 RepID=A0A177AVP4_9BILA|nr:hypothetical protein A3Q56_06233 [Intoshia linei]